MVIIAKTGPSVRQKHVQHFFKKILDYLMWFSYNNIRREKTDLKSCFSGRQFTDMRF